MFRVSVYAYISRNNDLISRNKGWCDELNTTQKILIELIKNSLFECDDSFILSYPIEWHSILKEAQDQTVVGLIASTLSKDLTLFKPSKMTLSLSRIS